MYTKKEFTEKLVKTVNSFMDDSCRAEIRYVEKINTGKVQTLVISNAGSCISPNFYIDGFYKDYMDGKAALDRMAEDIVKIYHNNTCMPAIGINIQECFNNREWLEERMFLQLINSGKNKELLKDSLYIDFKGLSLVLYVMVMEDGEGLAKARVTKAMCRKYGWDESGILRYALKNTEKLFPYIVMPLNEIIQKSISCTDIIKDITSGENDMIVVTNNKVMNGAAAAFYPGVLKGVSEKHGRSLFLIPSSIHEFIILEDNGIYTPEHLEKMLRDVNRSAVGAEEVLSDSLYYYGFTSGVLSVFNNGRFEEICRIAG